jgi:phage shock protein PspC (stress-responsive transcriptional regulator)
MSEVKSCPWCAETIRAEAVKCRHCGSFVESRALTGLSAPWVRPRRGRMLAGVCAGLAQQFGISVTVLRLAFLLGVIFSGGVVLLLYVALWVSMPRSVDAGEAAPRPVGGPTPPPLAPGPDRT